MSAEQPTGDLDLIEAVADHWEKYLGPCTMVYDEKVSEFVHLDVHQFGPDPETGLVTLVTSGMAEKPMNVPTHIVDPENFRFCELVLQVPDSWIKSLGEVPIYGSWPFRELKSLALLPHRNDSWVWRGHTFASSPLVPYEPDTAFCASILWPSYGLPPVAASLEMPDGRKIEFLTLGFLYAEELDAYRQKRFDGFCDYIDEVDADLFDFLIFTPGRQNICASKKPWWKRN